MKRLNFSGKRLLGSLFCLLTAMLAACGGGGGSSPAEGPPPVAPTITTQPVNIALAQEHGGAEFSIGVSGTPAPTITWQTSTDGTSWRTTLYHDTTFPFLNVLLQDDGLRIRAVVSNSAGTVTSDTVTLHVIKTAEIVQGLGRQAWRPGETDAYFEVTAMGEGLSYQWEISSDNGASFTDVPGATSNRYLHERTADASVNMVQVKILQANEVTAKSAAELRAMDWREVGARPTAQDLTNVAWVDTDTAVVGTSTDTLLLSRDNGLNWATVSEPITLGEGGFRIAFNGAGVGIAAARSGEVLRSTDGGQHWRQPSDHGGGVGAWYATAASFSNASQAVIVTIQGHVYHSDDVGNTWTKVVSDAPPLRDLAMNGAGVGLAVGDGGTVLRTTDHGAHWTTSSTTNSGAGVVDVAFASATRVFASQDNGALLRSDDGGASWSQVYANAAGVPLTSLLFRTTKVGFAIYGGRVHTTVDAGASWRALDAVPSGSYEALAMNGAGKLIAVGRSGAMVLSTNGGSVWDRIGNTTSGVVQAVAGSGTGMAAAVGSNGLILRSTDAGATWLQAFVPSSDDVFFHAVSYARQSSVALAVGTNAQYKGVVYATDDGGHSWWRRGTSGLPVFRNVAVADPRVAVAVSDDRQLYRTADAGHTWTQVTRDSTVDEVTFGNASIGLAAGSSLLRTTDGGLTWTAISGDPVRQIAFASPEVAVGVRREVLVRSEDGGLTWSAVVDHVKSGLLVAFASPTVGLASGLGERLHTQDGGLTWVRDHWSNEPHRALTFVDAHTAIMLSDIGVMRRNDR